MTALAWAWAMGCLWAGLWLLMREVEWFDAHATLTNNDTDTDTDTRTT